MSDVSPHERVVSHLRDALAHLATHIEHTSHGVDVYLTTPPPDPDPEEREP